VKRLPPPQMRPLSTPRIRASTTADWVLYEPELGAMLADRPVKAAKKLSAGAEIILVSCI
jgi:hypothetical protein